MALVNNLAEKSEKGLAVVRLHHRQELLSSCSSPPSPISTVDDRINGSRPKSSASQSQFLLDGICLSEGGMNYLRSLQMDQPRRRCRAKNKAQSLESADGDLKDDAEDGDSLFKDGTLLTPREDGRMPDVPEGYTVVQGENGALILRKKRQRNMQKLGIGGFQVRRPWARVKDKEEDAMDNYNTAEVTLQQLKDTAGTTATTPTPTPTPDVDPNGIGGGSKPKRKPQRRKAKNKLAETYPAYLQEAFFGRDLLQKPGAFLSDSLSANDSSQTAKGSGSDSEPSDDVPIRAVKEPSIIHLSKEEVADLESRTKTPVGPAIVKQAVTQPAVPQQSPQLLQNKMATQPQSVRPAVYPPVRQPVAPVKPELEEEDNEEEEEEEAQALKDILPLAGDLLDSDDLVDSIMKEGDAGVDAVVDDEEEPTLEDEPADLKPIQQRPVTHQLQSRDELTDMLLSEHINLETMVGDSVGGLPNMDSKDVEDIFKGVLTDESQESQSADTSAHFQLGGQTPAAQQQQPPPPQQHSMAPSSFNSNGMMTGPSGPAIVRALSQQSQQQGTSSPSNLNAAVQQQQLPPPSPYFSEYSSSPGFSPAFSEPPQSPWPSAGGGGVGLADHGSDPMSGEAPATANQRNALKWEADEALGLNATISAVLFANTNHPELKRDFPGTSHSIPFRGVSFVLTFFLFMSLLGRLTNSLEREMETNCQNLALVAGR